MVVANPMAGKWRCPQWSRRWRNVERRILGHAVGDGHGLPDVFVKLRKVAAPSTPGVIPQLRGQTNRRRDGRVGQLVNERDRLPVDLKVVKGQSRDGFHIRIVGERRQSLWGHVSPSFADLFRM